MMKIRAAEEDEIINQEVEVEARAKEQAREISRAMENGTGKNRVL